MGTALHVLNYAQLTTARPHKRSLPQSTSGGRVYIKQRAPKNTYLLGMCLMTRVGRTLGRLHYDSGTVYASRMTKAISSRDSPPETLKTDEWLPGGHFRVPGKFLSRRKIAATNDERGTSRTLVVDVKREKLTMASTGASRGLISGHSSETTSRPNKW